MRTFLMVVGAVFLVAGPVSAQVPQTGFVCKSSMSAMNVARVLAKRGMNAALFESRKRADCVIQTVSVRDIQMMHVFWQGDQDTSWIYLRFDQGTAVFLVMPAVESPKQAVRETGM